VLATILLSLFHLSFVCNTIRATASQAAVTDARPAIGASIRQRGTRWGWEDGRGVTVGNRGPVVTRRTDAVQPPGQVRQKTDFTESTEESLQSRCNNIVGATNTCRISSTTHYLKTDRLAFGHGHMWNGKAKFRGVLGLTGVARGRRPHVQGQIVKHDALRLAVQVVHHVSFRHV